MDARIETRTLRIPAMDCAAEEAEIRRALDRFDAIRRLTFRLAERSLVIEAPGQSMAEILAAIRSSGFDAELVGAGGAQTPHDHDHEHVEASLGKSGVPRLIAALGLAFVAEAIAYWTPEAAVGKGIEMAVAAAAIALSGFTTYRKGVAALAHGRLNINALMAVAVTGAFLIGQWPEAAMVMALYAIAELIEARAVDRARGAITRLMALAPPVAEVRQGDGTWKSVDPSEVAIGSIVRVKPGERVPLDGSISAGTSSINQAPVTGESIPVEKTVGEPVFAGTINETAALEVRVTAKSNDSTLARIIHAVEQAQATRAPTQRFVDRFAAIYTPAVFLIALAVALLGPLAAGWAWTAALYKALVLLVIACPCALVISTPVTVVSGLAAAARRGILVKGGVHLEEAHRIKAVALDKTGTITVGKPSLVAWEIIDATVDRGSAATLTASLAASSDHPVARAIADGIDGPRHAIEAMEAIPGRGMRGAVNGQTLTLGNHRLIEEMKVCNPELEARLFEQERQGRTVTMLASNERVLAFFAVADTIKPSARDAVAGLKRLGVTPVLLTGDNAATAQAIGAQAGISEIRANLLPEEKLAAIKELKQRSGRTAMVGDGINDAPALAEADIGIAMGGAGTDIAMEAADVVVMNDDLKSVGSLVRLSRSTRSVLWQNITLALGIKAVFLVLALLGNATMWMAVFADMGASLLVVFNGLRLLKQSA